MQTPSTDHHSYTPAKTASQQLPGPEKKQNPRVIQDQNNVLYDENDQFSGWGLVYRSSADKIDEHGQC